MEKSVNNSEPAELLREFVSSIRNERVFADLVASLSGLVYSSAFRRTGNAQLAEEITQNVFAIMARKATALQGHPSLAAWALETTKLQSASTMRSEYRRQRKIASYSKEPRADESSVDPAWQDAIPELDAAMDRLPQRDRALLLQRFFEGRKFKEIASGQGQSEAACKMRLKRVLEKLSKLLSARGVTLSLTALTSALTTELCRAAPVQVAAVVGPKALAASSSVSTATLLTNSLFTMSTYKATTTTALLVFALAAIPISQQIAEGSRLKAQLKPSGQSFAESRDDPRLSSRATGRRTPTNAGQLRDSLNQPLENRVLIATLLENGFSMDPIDRAMAWSRVARMTKEEHAQLLKDLSLFPCDQATKDLMSAYISDYAPKTPPVEHLERMLASGRNSFTQKVMWDWAEEDPAAALAWFEEKKVSGALDPGLHDKLYRSMATDLLIGMASSDPRGALEFYRSHPREELSTQALEWLAGAYAGAMLDSGNDEMVMALLETHSGKDQQQIIKAVFAQYGKQGQYDEGLAFVDQHNENAGARVSFIAEMIPWTDDIPGALDWAMSVTSEEQAPATLKRLTSTADQQRHVAGDEVRKWLASQPEGPLRDQGYAGLVDAGLRGYNYPKALAAADKISDPDLREKTRSSVGQRWLKQNEKTAKEELPSDLLKNLLIE